MHVSIKWFGDNFNVQIASKEGKEEFLSIKGCRIASGSSGEFVSFPSTKKANGDGYWNHVWASRDFGDHVLKLARAAKPKQEREPGSDDGPDDPLPF